MSDGALLLASQGLAGADALLGGTTSASATCIATAAVLAHLKQSSGRHGLASRLDLPPHGELGAQIRVAEAGQRHQGAAG